MSKQNDFEPKTATLAETDTYIVWTAEEPDNEITYHLELNNITIHFFKEEWEAFLEEYADPGDFEPDEEGFYTLEVDNVLVFMSQLEWNEFTELMSKLK